MSERIVIEFDDEEEKPKANPEENRIEIDFEEEDKKPEAGKIEAGYEETILNSQIDSFYKGNLHLNNSFHTELKFPEGIDHGFRKKFSLNLKDEFFNSILENNRSIILASKNNNVYLTDRFTGKINAKIFFENESFEKTGLVHENKAYINSLKNIYRLSQRENGETENEKIYSSPEHYFIWSNLNRHKKYILFTEYSASEKKASIRILDVNNLNHVTDFSFTVSNFISDKICIANGSAFVLSDKSLIIYDLEKMTAGEHEINTEVDENSFIFYLNYRLYITSHLNELYYVDLPAMNYNFKTTGIKNSYINSIGGFEDNIFIGTLDGWKFYKSGGLQIYAFEDEFENKIECISKNILVISKNNKIVFCNLNRFQEAEGYVIASNEKNEPVEIISAIISNREIFVLTGKGVLEAFTNDKMNIHL